MEIPEGAPQTVYETLFILQKDGIQKEFSLDNYPDSTWTFVDSKSKIIKEGYTPKIHDFTITTLEGEEITDIVLSDTSYTFLLIAYKFEKANDTEVDKINEIFDYALSNNYPFYCLTSSTRDEIRKWVRNTGAEYPICTTDETTLKTIIRSNPGLLLLKQGVVYNKWPNKLLPSGEVLEKPLTENKLGQIAANNDRIELLVCSLVLLIPLIIFYLQDIRWRRKTKTH